MIGVREHVGKLRRLLRLRERDARAVFARGCSLMAISADGRRCATKRAAEKLLAMAVGATRVIRVLAYVRLGERNLRQLRIVRHVTRRAILVVPFGRVGKLRVVNHGRAWA